MLVGVVAQTSRIRFGAVHHALYATAFAGAIAAAVLEPHPGLLVTLGALAALPSARPRTIWHPALAALGLLGYGAALLA